jgi:hypothetical protein
MRELRRMRRQRVKFEVEKEGSKVERGEPSVGTTRVHTHTHTNTSTYIQKHRSAHDCTRSTGAALVGEWVSEEAGKGTEDLRRVSAVSRGDLSRRGKRGDHSLLFLHSSQGTCNRHSDTRFTSLNQASLQFELATILYDIAGFTFSRFLFSLLWVEVR